MAAAEVTVPEGQASSSTTDGSHPDESSVHTNLSVEMGCPVCLNETVEMLETNPIIDGVVVHSAEGCFEVTHHGSVDEVITMINRVGHGVDIASNGETIMTPVRAVAVGTCEHRNQT